MLREKGQGIIGGHISGGEGDHTGWNVHGAYSPARNWGLIGDAFWTDVDEGSEGGGGHLITGGAGYYRPFSSHFMWDTYGILGFGGVENHLNQGNISSSFVRYGVQPSAGFTSKHFDAFMASRIVGLRYFNVNGTYAQEVQYLSTAGTQFLLEPALTLRAGIDSFKFQFEVGNSFNLTNSSFKQESGILSAGFIYSFRRK
jgi:hypothetical protein